LAGGGPRILGSNPNGGAKSFKHINK
jgi:hypothetical protein